MTEMTEQPKPDTSAAEELSDQLDGLIRHALSRKYTSYSSQNRIPTGNAYQSVRLRDEVFSGFRTLRSSVLAGLNLKGAKVLDLGCNLGELSRLARRLGAAIVDGFEYDPLFVQIGQAINALNSVSRVSLYQHDVTDPSIYVEPYDIVFSFSVFAYTQKVLPQIAMNCRQMFVLETHKVTENWPKEYIRKVVPHFQHYCIVERTDWAQSREDGARLLLVFAHEKAEIVNYIAQRNLALANEEDGYRLLDVPKSDPKFFRVFKKWLAGVPVKNVFELEKRVTDELRALGDLTQSPDYPMAASGLIYWLAYLEGFFLYYRTGRIDRSNAYIQYLHHACRDINIDPFMAKLVECDDAQLYERVQRRFDDTRAAIAGERIAPILVFNAMPGNPALPSSLVDAATGTRLSYSHQDGYHRHFSCLVAGVERLAYRTIWHPQDEQFARFVEQSPSLEDQLFAALANGLFPTATAEHAESGPGHRTMSNVA